MATFVQKDYLWGRNSFLLGSTKIENYAANRLIVNIVLSSIEQF